MTTFIRILQAVSGLALIAMGLYSRSWWGALGIILLYLAIFSTGARPSDAPDGRGTNDKK
ncbi:MAG: hypothetical protein ACYDBB_24995 [Armatimonadota bacterium]